MGMKHEDLMIKARDTLGISLPAMGMMKYALPYREEVLLQALSDCEESGVSLARLSEESRGMARQALDEGTGASALASFGARGSSGEELAAEDRLRELAMAKALAEEAIQEIVETGVLAGKKAAEPGSAPPLLDAKVKGCVERFADALMALREDVVGFGLDHFKERMSVEFPELSRPHPDVEGRRALGLGEKSALLNIFAERPAFTEDLRYIAIEAISDSDKFALGKIDRGTAPRSRKPG